MELSIEEILSCYAHAYSFDGTLTDQKNVSIDVDCNIVLPLTRKEKVVIQVSVPNSEMPIREPAGQLLLKSKENTGQKILIEDLWIKNIKLSQYPERTTGSTNIEFLTAKRLTIRETTSKHQSSELQFYLSTSDFFRHGILSQRKAKEYVDVIHTIQHPKLGAIEIQRLWSIHATNDINKTVCCSDICLSIPIEKECISIEEIIENLKPLLNIISVLLRQRISIIGWRNQNDGTTDNVWIEPFDPLITPYNYDEPDQYLISEYVLTKILESAITSYASLNGEQQKWLFYLSYALSPAIDRRTSEKFMALYKVLEKISAKIKKIKELTPDDNLILNLLEKSAKDLPENLVHLQERVRGLKKRIEGLSSTEKIETLLTTHDIHYKSLWSMSGAWSLTEIRNKLAHIGEIAVHHHGLSIATDHLEIIVQRLFFSILGIDLEDHVTDAMNNNYRTAPCYWLPAQADIFNVDRPL